MKAQNVFVISPTFLSLLCKKIEILINDYKYTILTTKAQNFPQSKRKNQ